MAYIFGNWAEKEIQDVTGRIFTQQNLKNVEEANSKYTINLWHWLFICRRQLYRDRIFCGLKRDENLNVIRDENGNIEFLEEPREWKKLVGLNDNHLYQKLLLDRLHPMYAEFIAMLGDGNTDKGKDVLRKKLIKEEYALSTEAVEYARAKIFAELEADIAYTKKRILETDGEFSKKHKDLFDMRVTDRYFELGMQDKRDMDYEDKLADCRLGKQRFDNWKKDAFDRDRAKIQIDFYCKEWIAENGEDRFVLFDNVSEDIIKPNDFKALLTRYTPFIPKCKDLYAKYEIMMWGSTSKEKGNGKT